MATLFATGGAIVTIWAVHASKSREAQRRWQSVLQDDLRREQRAHGLTIVDPRALTEPLPSDKPEKFTPIDKKKLCPVLKPFF